MRLRLETAKTSWRKICYTGNTRKSIVPFLRQCLRQVDYVAAQRVKRTQQWVRFYSGLWPRDRLEEIFVTTGRRLWLRLQNPLRNRALTFAGAVFAYRKEKNVEDELEEHDKDHEKSDKHAESEADEKRQSAAVSVIPDNLMANHVDDLTQVHELTRRTLICATCDMRRSVSGDKAPNVRYCDCPGTPASAYGVPGEGEDAKTSWTPFLERPDILIWRREIPDHAGLYAYKMYGRFEDVTADEFLEVQLDLSSFRMSWDSSTAQCHILDESRNHRDARHTDQVYYWEVNWPRFFSNRDYVAARRSRTFHCNGGPDKSKVMVVYSRSTTHPDCPEKSKNFRVKEYWSVLTIKPFSEFDEPGIEFCLTAFENPGVSLPSSVTTWVALRGMPDFMVNLRKACFEMRKWKKTHNASSKKDCSSTTTTTSVNYQEASSSSNSYHQKQHSYA